MSAQLAAGSGLPSNHFSAHLALAAGVTAIIHAPTLSDLQVVVARLQPTAPATNDGAKAAATPAAQAQPQGNAPASTGTPASAPAAAAGSEASDGERPNYNHVRDAVLALSKKGRQFAVDALAKFGVDHGNKLKLEDYPAFLEHAKGVLGASK